VTLDDVAFVLQRTEMLMRVAAEIERYISELGSEGRLISLQLDELLTNVDADELFIMKIMPYVQIFVPMKFWKS